MVKKRIIPIMLCMCVLITCVNTGVFATNESLFSAWKPWSFYATSGNDAESLEGAGYGDVTNSEYYLPVVPQYVSSNSVQAGVLVTPEKDGRSRFYIRPEYEWDVKISEDLKERATFYLDSNDRVKSGKGQIVVGFTVPEDGTYNIYGNFVNAGGNDYLTEKETLGDGGFARISILPKGENLETKDNTNEVKIPVASEGKWKEEIYEKDNNDLKKGDRIFLRVSSGDNGIGDVFQVVYRISSIASDGKVLSTYDIRDLVDKQENSDIADNVQTVIDSSYIPKTEQSEEISEHAVALSVYGVIAESDVGNYSLEKNITRDEFAYLVGTIIGSGINSPKAKSEYFSDVDDTCNGFYIDALLHSGIISPSVTFDPRGNVAYKDALKMLVCATGYGIKAEEKGGYPHGYLKVANEKEIFLDKTLSSEDFITRKDACELIDKALGIDILKRETYGEESSEYSVKDGYNLLYETFKIIEENGIVTGAGKNTLTGPASYKANQIEVDGKVFNTDIVNAKDYLGYSVKYYYKDKNDGIIIRIDKRNINKELAVKAQDVTDFNYTKIEYENMGKNKKVSVSTKADFLMNDRVVAFKEPMMDYFKNDGYVKLIDNNGDSSYDVVMLNTYTNMVVDTKDSKNMIIVDKYKENRSSQINKSHSFEINDYDDISYCFENGNVADFEDINEWDILSLFESQDKRCLKVVVGRDKVTGSVKEIINNGETQKIIIDNKAYEISKDYQTRGDIEIYPGMEGTFYLDRSKKIAAIYSNETDRIGYLLNASKAGGLDDDKFRIVTSTGETVDYAGSDKMTLNAEEQLSSQKIIERLTLPDGKIKSQMISYRLAGGKIKKIYTAGIGSDTEKIFTQQYAEGLKYHGGSKIVGGKIAINENTLLFNIPTQDDLARGDKATVSKAASALGHFQVYPDLISVKTTKNQIESDALCLVGADNTGYIPEFDPLMIVSAINEAVNEKGEQIKNIKLIKNGKEIEFLTAKEDTLKNVKPAYESFTGTYEIGVGDIIRCSINSKNELTYAVLYFDASSKSMLAPNPNVDYLGRPRLYYANIYDKQGKFLKVTTNDPSAVVSDAECEIQGIKRIYIVDPKNTKKPIDEGSYVDLKSYLGDASNYTKALFITMETPQDIVIYK